jgi:hypothetical protein
LALSIAGIIYGAIVTLKQKDIKKFLAYSSLSHVGLIAAGLYSLTIEGFQGAVLQMLSHGIVIVGLFYVVELIYSRYNTYEIKQMGGIRIQDTSALVIPEIDWEKNLKPEGDSNYIDILKTMTEAGVPVPIRAMAAAGGIKLDKVLKGQEDDIETRKKLQAYNAKIQELMPKPPEGGEGGDGGFEGFSAAIAAAFGALPKEKKRELLDLMPTRSSVLNTGGKPNLLRGHENFEITELSKTGKKKSVYNQRRANDKANDLIVKAMKNMGRQGKLL